MEDDQHKIPSDNDETIKQSNWPLIIVIGFVLFPALLLFVTEMATDKLIYRTISEKMSQHQDGS